MILPFSRKITLVATFFTNLGANNAIGISAIVGLIVAYFIFKPKFSLPFKDGIRLTDNVGTTGILPQVLAALGSLFTAAGVGAVIAAGVGAIIPEGNHFIAVAVYCIGYWLSILNRSRSKSSCCRCFRVNCRILWYINDTNGCKLQYYASGFIGNEE